MNIWRLKVLVRVYAALYRLAYVLLRLAYPECLTELEADGERYSTRIGWRGEDGKLVGQLQRISPPHDPHRCPRCLQPVGAVGWHITGREHDSCAGRVEPLHTLIEKGSL